MTGTGIAGVVIGIALVVLSPWAFLTVAGCVLIVAALIPLALGGMMIAYAVAGKRRFRDWMLARHPWRGDEHVLDVGAGRGLMTIGAAQLVPSGRVIAIDIWRDEDLGGNRFDALRANLDATGVATRVSVETMDARAIRLPDASIDVVLSVLCLHNIEPAHERRRALAEIARVLRPGGVAYIADYTATGSYAEAFNALGLKVVGPVNAVPIALSLMFLVEARKARDHDVAPGLARGWSGDQDNGQAGPRANLSPSPRPLAAFGGGERRGAVGKLRTREHPGTAPASQNFSWVDLTKFPLCSIFPTCRLSPSSPPPPRCSEHCSRASGGA